MSNFSGQRLRVVRSLHGLTQTRLAELVATSPATISRAERGQNEPSASLLEALAEVLSVSPSFFSRPISNEISREKCSFRHVQSTSKQLLDRVVARATLLRDALEKTLDFAELPSVDIPEMTTSSPEGIEEAAVVCRNHWKLGDGPISNMIRVVERAGAVVAEHTGHTRKVDAFSHPGNPPVIILASIKKSTSRARFNVAHELGHLVLHQAVTTGKKATEKEADHFAGAFLLPRTTFASEFRSLRTKGWPEYFELKRRWKVSVFAILTRAHQLSLLGTAQYRRHIKHYYWKKWHKGEPYEPAAEVPEVIKMALDVVEEVQGDLSRLIEELGWSPKVAEEILPIKFKGQPLPENVTRLSEWKK